jgi:phospholipase/carboxylesterase
VPRYGSSTAITQFDQLIPPPQTERLALLLEQAGADVTLHWEPASHTLNRAEVQGATAWLRAHIRNQPV